MTASDDDLAFSAAASMLDASENVPVNPTDSPAFCDVVRRRFGRRDVLRGALGTSVFAALSSGSLGFVAGARPARAAGMRVSFTEIRHGADGRHHVAPGYDADVLIRWGDPVLPGAPPFDPASLTAEEQEMLFGYNNDFIGFVPLPPGSDSRDRGLLCINHEYTIAALMFPRSRMMTRQLTEVEMAAHGGSIVEVNRGKDGKWRLTTDGAYNRRISTRSTEMRLAGPAAGHPRLRTADDPSGARVIGTVNNCAGGITPWGTWLMAEENFNGYFLGELAGHPEGRNYRRYGIPRSWHDWGRFHRRWNLNAEPNEANRFGWIVEVDPLDRASMPVKHTALGRFKHEGAETVINRDGRIVVYSGDDQPFEYLYRFVSDGRYDPRDRRTNMSLLDSGTLHVARFEADGSVTWLPLVFGSGGLVPANGFESQADVLIETRRAADILGATPMDRPEDVQPNAQTGKIYVMLTNNRKRKPDRTDGPNARPGNLWGQIVELTPPDGDHTAPVFGWDILVQCGDPADPAVGATWNPATTRNGWFADPDNAAVDGTGRLWVATDQGSGWARSSGTADGLWALETEGPTRGTGRMFFRAPIGAEVCGPCFVPGDRALFLSVQHPGSDGVSHYRPFGRKSSNFEVPATRWPDFDPKMPPRPSVVVVTRRDGGTIGS